MDVAFQQWSKRTLRTLQVLARRWTVSEACTEPSLPEGPHNQPGHTVPNPGSVEASFGGQSFVAAPADSGSCPTPLMANVTDLGNMDWLFDFNTVDGWSDDMLHIGGLDYSLWDFDSIEHGARFL